MFNYLLSLLLSLSYFVFLFVVVIVILPSSPEAPAMSLQVFRFHTAFTMCSFLPCSWQ